MTKPVLIGMNNPLSREPGFELYPAPKGCSGYHIWQMMNRQDKSIMRLHYINKFERMNLVVGEAWDRDKGRRRAEELKRELAGRKVVLFGEEVRKSFGHQKQEIGEPYMAGDMIIGMSTFHQLPHPSGMNRWYNDPKNAELAARLLVRLYREET